MKEDVVNLIEKRTRERTDRRTPRRKDNKTLEGTMERTLVRKRTLSIREDCKKTTSVEGHFHVLFIYTHNNLQTGV